MVCSQGDWLTKFIGKSDTVVGKGGEERNYLSLSFVS